MSGADAAARAGARARATTRKTTLDSQDDSFDREFWASLTPSEKVAEAWRLSEEIWRFTERQRGEPGVPRDRAHWPTRVVRG